jgi:hypothetical protein
MKAPDVKDQCHCHECNFHRIAFGGADIFYHCGTQASYTNWKNGVLDEEKSFIGNAEYLMREVLKKIDWPDTLKDYDHINLEVRLIGYKGQKSCKCELKVLLKSGCQCGGN